MLEGTQSHASVYISTVLKTEMLSWCPRNRNISEMNSSAEMTGDAALMEALQ